MKKIMPICIAGILLCTVFSAAALTSEKKQYNDLSKGSPLVFIYGTEGNNTWYISEVHISFQWNPSDVAEIWYRLKIGEDYIKYVGEFTVSDDGSHIIPWYWIDKNNTIHDELPLEFGIDKTPPTIEISKRKLINKDVVFTATTSDAVSGIEKVIFFCDEVPQVTLTEEPYEWTWSYIKENQDVQAITYDYAGHIKESNILGTPCSYVPSLYLFIRLLIQRLFPFVAD